MRCDTRIHTRTFLYCSASCIFLLNDCTYIGLFLETKMSVVPYVYAPLYEQCGTFMESWNRQNTSAHALINNEYTTCLLKNSSHTYWHFFQ